MNNTTDMVTAANGKALIPAADANDIVGASAGDEIETGIEAPLRVGLTIAFLVFGVFGLWSLLAPIESAAHAQGSVTPRSYKKPVQHLEGGIVKEVLIQNGDVVKAGDVLFVMDSTRPLAELGILQGQLLSLLAMEARLLAERSNAEQVTYPPELVEAGARGELEINAQNQIFNTRKAALEGNVAVLEQRISQLKASIDGMKAQRESREELAASYGEELETVKSLLSEGYDTRPRLREVERAHATATGDVAELTANIASTEIRIGETQLEIQQAQNTFQTEVAAQLSETQNQLKDTRERITTLSDIVSRTEVRATDSGVINGLKVHTSGTVIPPGEVIAEIVPQDDELVIEAMVSIGDIDRVAEGQDASIRMTTLNARRTPNIEGRVLSVSADTTVDQRTGTAYYTARIAVTEESLAELQDVALVPGMPAEVFIATGSRTFMQYITKSISDSWARSFRED